eukprot:4379542-Ditylum_brightwellii.AAC.1
MHVFVVEVGIVFIEKIPVESRAMNDSRCLLHLVAGLKVAQENGMVAIAKNNWRSSWNGRRFCNVHWRKWRGGAAIG